MTDIAQLEALAAQLNDAIKLYKDNATSSSDDLIHRRPIIQKAQQILHATKAPEEQWLDQSVSMAEMSVIRCFMDWGAFDLIPQEGSISYKELAEKLEAEENLIIRLASIMVATGTLQQIGSDQLAHTRLSKVYSGYHPSGIMFQIMFDEGLIPYAQFKAYFEKYGRKEPKASTHNPHTFAWGRPEADSWEVITSSPKRLKDFAQSMNTLEQLLPITGFYDFSWIVELASKDKERVLLVDVGGGGGQAIKGITKENPGIDRGRCVLQDRADVIAAVEKQDTPELQGVKKTVHDFFTKQPVEGAAAYYIRRCLHDYSDERCVGILKHLADAAAPDSRILITEQIMTNPPSLLSAQTDICMLGIGGKERTEKAFQDLAAASGLKILGFHMAKGTEVGVVECVKA